ncbi:hypothetical protein QFX71_001782 [Citrobacter amalonaticus]|nr:hypothetical protein [Citrobacter amalonaticus]
MKIELDFETLSRLDEIAHKRGISARGIIYNLVRQFLEKEEQKTGVKVSRHPPTKTDDCETLPTVLGVC